MNDFIAKYQDQLNGTLSGFDRLVFSGTLWKERLTGMKGYLWAHGLAAKDFGEHAEQISKRVKEASLAAVLAANRPVNYLNSGKDDKQQIALRIALKITSSRAHLRAQRSVVVPKLCHPTQSPDPAARIGDRPTQVPVPVSLPDASRGRLHERSSADLVSLFSSHLPQRPGVAGPPDGSGGNQLSPAR
jgi:hypothetical protein